MRSSRRAVMRWGWRLFQRDWRQQLLTIALLVVVVAAAVTGSAMVVNAQFDHTSFFGDAEAVVRLDGRDPATTQAALQAIAPRFASSEAVSHSRLSVPGSTRELDLRRQAPGGPLTGRLLRLVEGRYPSTEAEVALTSSARKLLRAQIGDTVDIQGAPRTVVGLVENPRELDDNFVLAVPDASARADFVNVFVSGPVNGFAVPDGNGVQDILRRDMMHDPPVAPIVVFGMTTLFALVGLVATAGFVVVAQRRQRQLGMLAAVGGSPTQLRAVMIANGLVVGLVAAILGTGLGIVGWVLVRPAIERAADHRLGFLELPWKAVVVSSILALVTAAAAAWWPARQLSRLPIMTALSGRPAPPRPVHRSVLVACVLLVAGVGLVTAGNANTTHARPMFLMAGLVVTVIGVVAITPAVVRLLGRLARHLPFAPRLALRDLSRYQSRSAASVAAIALGLGLSVSIVAIASASEYSQGEGNLASNQLVVQLGDVRRDPSELSQADRDNLDREAAGVLTAAGAPPGVALDVALNPSADKSRREPISVATPIDADTFNMLGFAFVGTPEVLQYFGIDPATIDPATDLLIAADRDVVLLDTSVRPDGSAPPPATQVVDALPAYGAAPFALITEAGMQRHGWVPARAAWFTQLPKAVTTAQVDAARTAAAAAGLQVTSRDEQDSLSSVRTWTTVSGVVLALAIVVMSIGLLRGEGAADLRTLTATGAAPRTRRALTAATAAALSLLGAVLGTVGAYAVLLAAYHNALGDLLPLPLPQLLSLLVGLPLVATIGGWALAGREPSTVSRRLLT